MDVLFLAPAYPVEMRSFTRGLAAVGARVWGVGDQPVGALPEEVRDALTGYLQVPRILDEDDVIRRVGAWLGGRRPDRVEALWEPLVILAARLRETLGVPGMSVDTVLGFRDKELMKARLRAAGLRVPHSARCRTEAEVRAAADRIGFPVIVKPIAGAGSADTFRCDDRAALDHALAASRHVAEVSVEEFVEGEEFTYDTVCVNGEPALENVCKYLPRPLVARTEHWISPAVITVRDLNQPHLRDGIRLGRAVLSALGMGSGFTHMEWYRKADGEVVFGEIGARPGGARMVDQINLTTDTDTYVGWARAVTEGRFGEPTARKYNVAIVFKRAHGEGRIRRIDGLDALKARWGRWFLWDELLPVGSPRRNWKQTLVSDGFLLGRHPDWDTAVRFAMDAATNVRLYAS